MTHAITERHPIIKRDLRFPLEKCDFESWHPGGIHVSHFFNALSIFFPEGETFFIDSVRHYAGRIRSPELAEDVRCFGGQEAMHSREHRRYNRALAEAGLPVRQLEAIVERVLEIPRRFTPATHHLAATIALEHFTAIMARVLLEEEAAFLAGADPRLAALWRWHAAEETEHKSVAYDVYREIRGDNLFAWLERSATMLIVSAIFWPLVFGFHLRLVRASGATTDLRGWGRLFQTLFVSPGLLTKIVVPWLSYFRPRFHPSQHDSSALVDSWKASHPLDAAPI